MRFWCRQHGYDAAPYVMCVHVLDGAPIDHLAWQGGEVLGEVLCADCLLNLPGSDDLKLVCSRCTEALFADRAVFD